MYCYTIGKEEICLALAKKFCTKVILDSERYESIVKVGFHPQFFTMKKNEGFIHMTKGVNKIEKDYDDINKIHINLTGWINCEKFIKVRDREYLVAYSSHSNYSELEEFVKIIRPGSMEKIVIERGEFEDVKKDKNFKNYFIWLKNLK